MNKKPVFLAMLVLLLALSLAFIGCKEDEEDDDDGGSGGGISSKELKSLEADYPGITDVYTAVIEMYKELKAEGGTTSDWNEGIDELNSEYPSLKLPKGDPKNWSKAVWIRIYNSDISL